MSYKCSMCGQDYVFFKNADACCDLGFAIYSDDTLNNWSAPDYVKTIYDEEYLSVKQEDTYE